MHDTCHTANKKARLAKELREASGQLHYGYDEWEEMANEDKPWFDFVCANHARNLPMDELNRLFNAYITTELGDSIKAIQVESGGRSRVEASVGDPVFALTLSLDPHRACTVCIGRWHCIQRLPGSALSCSDRSLCRACGKQ